jgi:hypothetical protein
MGTRNPVELSVELTVVRIPQATTFASMLSLTQLGAPSSVPLVEKAALGPTVPTTAIGSNSTPKTSLVLVVAAQTISLPCAGLSLLGAQPILPDHIPEGGNGRVWTADTLPVTGLKATASSVFEASSTKVQMTVPEIVGVSGAAHAGLPTNGPAARVNGP